MFLVRSFCFSHCISLLFETVNLHILADEAAEKAKPPLYASLHFTSPPLSLPPLITSSWLAPGGHGVI